MLSDNIKTYRKKNNMSQDELAEKLGVSRQSISLWETGQTQPTIDNIIALAKIFNISSDTLLGVSEGSPTSPASPAPPAPPEEPPADKKPKKSKTGLILAIIWGTAILIGAAVLILSSKGCNSKSPAGNSGQTSAVESEPSAPVGTESSAPVGNETSAPVESETSAPTESETAAPVETETSTPAGNETTAPAGKETTAPAEKVTSAPVETEPPAPAVPFDLFSYCKDFAIKIGRLNGDYCIYQQPATRYGGYENEYFAISYWGDSNMVEFCLHCPLSETQSINFYLRMRGGYSHKYEYLSSKYYRDTGESFRSATGYIDPAVFSDKYPLSCDQYDGPFNGQNDFMEESRIGICDLIHCLKEFVKVEKMECDFSSFEFVNF